MRGEIRSRLMEVAREQFSTREFNSVTVRGIAVVSATWGTLNWTFKAVGSDGSLIYVAPFKHIGASGFPLYSVLWDLASIVFYAAAAWLCMRRIQVRR